MRSGAAFVRGSGPVHSALFSCGAAMAGPFPAHGCDSGALLGGFGVLLQALLALCVCSTLMLKRFSEPKEQRRPWKIWFYDTSKQAVGALFIHFYNVFLSSRTEEDPCFLYLLNFILDTTLGMLLIWLGVKVVSRIAQRKKYKYLLFGEYGDPPQTAAWVGQCILYLLIVAFEKTVITFVLFIPGWRKLQQILLGYVPNSKLKLILVTFVMPFIVNAIMFWIVDSLIMRKYKQKDTLRINGSIKTPQAKMTEETEALISPDGDSEQSESDQDVSGPLRTSQKMKQPSYQVVI